MGSSGRRNLSVPSGTFSAMSCVPLTSDQQTVLETLATRGQVPEQLGDVVTELQRWGWIMPGGGELTGIGLRHAGAGRPGLLG
jgi:hypothetical protein